jgi:hypothetical protein
MCRILIRPMNWRHWRCIYKINESTCLIARIFIECFELYISTIYRRNATGNVSVQVTERSCKLQFPSRAHGLEVILVYESLQMFSHITITVQNQSGNLYHHTQENNKKTKTHVRSMFKILCGRNFHEILEWSPWYITRF